MTDMQKCISKKGKLEIHAHSKGVTVPTIRTKKLASKPGEKWYDLRSRAKDNGTAHGNGRYNVKEHP